MKFQKIFEYLDNRIGSSELTLHNENSTVQPALIEIETSKGSHREVDL